MVAKKDVVIAATVSAAAAAALALGLGLGLGLKKQAGIIVRGSVSSRELLPLKQQYVHRGDAYLVQTVSSAPAAIELYVAAQDAPADLSQYTLVPRERWPIPLPVSGGSRGTCSGGKEAKNACSAMQAGEFATAAACGKGKCEWGYKCRLGLACSPSITGAFSSASDCSGTTPCGWKYKCDGGACILAPDGTTNTFADCRAACT